MNKYDYVIVGAGMFGSICAYELNKIGKKVLVLEKRDHIGGNCFTEKKNGINIHKYGAHIFHTSNKEIWNYINKFSEFNNYRHHVIANYKDEIYSLPFNMFTFNKIWGITNPQDVKNKIESQKVNLEPTNLEEQAISLVGKDVYEILIKGYTEKQWGRKCKDLPPSIIKRLPVRYTWDNNYFNDIYQGVPIDGYTKIFKKMLQDIEVKLNVDYFKNKEHFNSLTDKIIYTGPIDRLFEYQFGKLEYRTLKFDIELHEIENYQGHSVINYTDVDIPYTRILEHKHFENSKSDVTYITKEYSSKWERGSEPYYPLNDKKNKERYLKYRNLARENNILLGGRLAEYKYYDMHQVVGSALKFLKKLNNGEKSETN